MMKRGFLTLSAVLVPLALGISSCDVFFSTSWGTARAYDADKINVSADTVDDWVAAAVGNPKLAMTLTDKIKDDLKGKIEQGKPTKDQAKLQDGGVKLAVEASGVGTSILSNSSTVVSKLGDDNEVSDSEASDIKNIISDIQQDFKTNDGGKAAGNLSEIVSGSLAAPPSSYANGGTPQFGSNDYAKNASAGDVGQAVVVLALGVMGDDDAKSIDLDDMKKYNIEVTDTTPKKATVSAGATPEAITLAAYLNLIADDTSKKYDDNPITSGIKDAFGLK